MTDTRAQICDRVDIDAVTPSGYLRFFSETFSDEILVVSLDDTFIAVSGFCPHFGGPIECRRADLYCPWHGLSFSKETLKSQRGSNELALQQYSVRVEGGQLVITK